MDISNYIQASINILRHYTEGLWEGFNYPINYIEIWNEPMNRDFWWGTKEQFFLFYEQVAKSLKKEFPDVEIGGPAFLPVQYFNQSFSEEFVQYCKENNVPLDFLSWHMYNDDMAAFTGAIDYYRDLLDRYGFTETESHITEWNTGSEDERRYNAAGAAFMSAIWIHLQKGAVDLSFIHRGQDSKMSHPEFYGIMYANGTYKKIAYAFRGWSWLMDYPSRVASEDDTDAIETLAVLNEDASEMGVLITHYSQDGLANDTENYKIDVQGWSLSGPIIVKRYLLAQPFDMELVNETDYASLSDLEKKTFLLPADSTEILFLSGETASSVETWGDM